MKTMKDIVDGIARVEEGATKHDQDKLPVHLLPFNSLAAISQVLALGAKKYSARNWEKGMSWHRLFRAANWHLWCWFMRAGPDRETGKSHLWHAGCCILFLIAHELREIGEDDRPSIPINLEDIA